MVMRQAKRELLTKLARFALDSFDGHGAPVTPSTGTDSQHGGLDPVPVEAFDGKDTPRIEQIAGCTPIDERNDLSGDDFMEVENEGRPLPARYR